jgi:hypothetical protein
MNHRLMNVCLAVLWLCLGTLLLAEEWTTGRPRFVIPYTTVSAAWAVLLLGGYNVLRWWLAGYAERSARTPRTVSTLQRPLQHPPGERPAEYDPNFDFGPPTEPTDPGPGP